jgi:hypothetical protein
MNASPSSPLEQLAMRVGAVTGALAGTVGFVYVVGGAVMWLRFWRSDVPADQALALVPKSDLLVVGMRVLILPALAAGGLFLWLAKRNNGTPKRLTFVLLAIPALVLALVVPLSFGSFAWPAAAVGLALVWAFVLPKHREQDGWGLVWRAGVAAMLAAALVSIARQLDHPVRLPSATLTFADKHAPVTGVLVSASPGEVVLGFPDKKTLQSYPRDGVQVLDIGPALDRRSPPASLLSQLLGDDAWAATPLELWCGGERYAWGHVGDLCQTQPTVRVRTAEFFQHAVRVQVRCPGAADEGCSGFFTLTTQDDFAIDNQSRAAPLRLGRTVFQVPSDSWVKVAIPINDLERRCLDAAGQPVALRALLSTDQAGQGSLNGRAGQRLDVAFSSKTPSRSCSGAPRLSDTTTHAAPDATPPPAPAPTATASPSATPSATATPTATATPAPTALPAAPPDPGDDVTLAPAISGG